MLVRLIYASRSLAPIDNDLTEKVLAAARSYNPAHGITGVLCYSDAIFVQALEGGREEVNRLYARIQSDPRHKELTLLDYAEIGARRFSDWTMGRVRLDKINLSLLLKYSDKASFDPFCATGRATAALLDELAAAGAITVRG
ncbi:BLUF domain-containing protein [Paludibacterium yongneupense]|uniref:BLUF domain-containing protein n=1 Tax=Paludibacterium yongneupense TaxID=400061 RepID=UPI0004237CC6|nr:BLUF domain-containing protein [Paludibacterium yongneupense]